MEISTPQLEIHYLKSAPPFEVLRYLDEKASAYKPTWLNSCISQELESELYLRNDILVDLGLSRSCSSEMADLLLKRHSSVDYHGNFDDINSDIALALFSNTSAFQTLGTPNWLAKCYKWISTSADYVHLKTLLLNLEIDNGTIDAILKKQSPFDEITSDRYGDILGYALASKPVTRPEDDESGEYDMYWHGTNQSIWSCVLNCDHENKKITYRLRSAIEHFHNIYVPYDELENLGLNVDVSHDIQLLVYLKKILTKWSNTNIPKDESYDDICSAYQNIREIASSKAPIYYDNIKQFVANHDDVYVRRGFYRGQTTESLQNLKKYYERDGIDFINGAVYNHIFYKRQNKELAKWLWEIVQYLETPDKEWEESPKYIFYTMMEKLSNQQPDFYFSNIEQIESLLPDSGYETKFEGDLLKSAQNGTWPNKQFSLAIWRARNIAKDSGLFGINDPDNGEQSFTIQQGLKAACHGREDSAATLIVQKAVLDKLWEISISHIIILVLLGYLIYKSYQ